VDLHTKHRAADDVGTIRARRIDIVDLRLEAQLGRPVRKCLTGTIRCDFCPLEDPNATCCAANCENALAEYYRRVLI